LFKRAVVLALFIPQIALGLVQSDLSGFVQLKGLFLRDEKEAFIFLNPGKRTMIKFNIETSASTKILNILESNSKINFCGFIEKRKKDKDSKVTLLKIRPLTPTEKMEYYDGQIKVSNDKLNCSSFIGSN